MASQITKFMRASAYDYTGDERWASFLHNKVPLLPDVAAERHPTLVDDCKLMFYKEFVDPDFLVPIFSSAGDAGTNQRRGCLFYLWSDQGMPDQEDRFSQNYYLQVFLALAGLVFAILVLIDTKQSKTLRRYAAVVIVLAMLSSIMGPRVVRSSSQRRWVALLVFLDVPISTALWVVAPYTLYGFMPDDSHFVGILVHAALVLIVLIGVYYTFDHLFGRGPLGFIREMCGYLWTSILRFFGTFAALFQRDTMLLPLSLRDPIHIHGDADHPRTGLYFADLRFVS